MEKNLSDIVAQMTLEEKAGMCSGLDFEPTIRTIRQRARGTDTDTLTVRVKVKNAGNVAGKEIVQLYVKDQESSVIRPAKKLKGFAKMELNPGEKQTITFDNVALELLQELKR